MIRDSKMDEKYNFEFSHNSEYWLDGYSEYVKLFRRKKTIILTSAFGVLSLLFLQQVIMDSSYGMGWVCFAISVSMMLITLLSPVMEKKNIDRNALDVIKDDRYIFRIYDDKYSVETILPESDKEYLETDKEGNEISYPDIPPTVTPLSEKSLKVIEKEGYFGFFSKISYCVIPKADLSGEDIKALKELADKINNK